MKYAIKQAIKRPIKQGFVGPNLDSQVAAILADGGVGIFDPYATATRFTTHDGSTAASVDDPVGRWEKSVLGLSGGNFTQAVSADRPTLKADGSKLYIEGNGVTQNMTRTGVSTSQRTIVVAARVVGTGNNRDLWRAAAAATLRCNASGGTFESRTNANNANAFVTVALTPSTDVVLVQRVSATEHLAMVNSLIDTLAITNPNSFTFTSLFSTGANIFTGRCYGAIELSRAVTDDELTILRQWAAQRAGVTL